MAHRDSHPVPIENCFGCKVQNVGVQTLQIKHGKNPVQQVPVLGEEGPRRGKKVGKNQVHWDGRQDATVFAPALKLETKAREM
jgi:hypothetical protein